MLETGQKVEIVDVFSTKLGSHVCYGVVERTTMTMIIVRNEHNNISRFRHDGKAVGYNWPYNTRQVKRV